jgi:methionyl-tRNA synthetase
VETIAEEFEAAKLQSAANTLISLSRIGNQYLNEKEPWNLLKTDKAKAATILYVAAQIVKALAIISAPFIPGTAEKLWQTLSLSGTAQKSRWEEALTPLKVGHKIAKAKPLFQKIDADEEQLDKMLLKVREKMANVE